MLHKGNGENSFALMLRRTPKTSPLGFTVVGDDDVSLLSNAMAMLLLGVERRNYKDVEEVYRSTVNFLCA